MPVGKWQLVEREGNDGAKDFRTPVKNGRVLTFYPGYLVRDNQGPVGNYGVHGNHLQLLLPQNKTEYYLWFFSSKVPDKLYMTPANDDYQCSCDEGRMDIYQKLGVSAQLKRLRSCSLANPSCGVATEYTKLGQPAEAQQLGVDK